MHISILAATLVMASLAPATAADVHAVASRASDLDVFEQQFFEKDASYNLEERSRAKALLAKLRTNAQKISAAEFELALARIAAVANNGHTSISTRTWAQRFNRLPVGFILLDDGLWIGDAKEPYASLRGSRVISIDNASVAKIRDKWSQYRGGEPQFRDDVIYPFLESPELLHAAGIAKGPAQVTLHLRLPDGRRVRRTVESQAAGSVFPWSSGGRLSAISRATDDAGKPLYLQEPDKPFRLIPLEKGYYLQFRANHGAFDGETVEQFAQRALETLRPAKPPFVILDQRLNSGGDLNTTRDLMGALGEIIGPSGRLVILTSGRTFSAGIASVAYAKQSAGSRTHIIGTPVGDTLEFWAEGSGVPLPASGGLALPATERHNYITGCPEADCHRSIRNSPIRVEHVRPDQEVRFRYRDFIAGTDPLMVAASKLVGPIAARP